MANGEKKKKNKCKVLVLSDFVIEILDEFGRNCTKT